METKVILSEKFTLQARDFVKGLIVAVITAALIFVKESLEKGVFNWDAIWQSAVGAGVGYLIKNFIVEPSKVITTVPSTVDAVKVEQDIKQVV